LSRCSSKRAKELEAYRQLKKDYFAELAKRQGLPEGHKPYCEVFGKPYKASDIHHIHSVGSGGAFLDKENLLAVSRKSHNFIHQNPKWARENGYLV
jgi:hypothetical protein